SRIRTPGLSRPRCTAIHPKTGATCDKPQHDNRQSHRWSIRKTTKPPRKKFELRKNALAMVEDTRYQRRLLRDLRTRSLKPSIECMLWAYAIGKPVEDEDGDMMTLEQQYRRLTPQQLYTRALAIARMLKEPDGE